MKKEFVVVQFRVLPEYLLIITVSLRRCSQLLLLFRKSNDLKRRKVFLEEFSSVMVDFYAQLVREWPSFTIEGVNHLRMCNNQN